MPSYTIQEKDEFNFMHGSAGCIALFTEAAKLFPSLKTRLLATSERIAEAIWN